MSTKSKILLLLQHDGLSKSDANQLVRQLELNAQKRFHAINLSTMNTLRKRLQNPKVATLAHAYFMLQVTNEVCKALPKGKRLPSAPVIVVTKPSPRRKTSPKRSPVKRSSPPKGTRLTTSPPPKGTRIITKPKPKPKTKTSPAKKKKTTTQSKMKRSPLKSVSKTKSPPKSASPPFPFVPITDSDYLPELNTYDDLFSGIEDLKL